MKLIILTIYIFISKILCMTFETSWGECTLINSETAINNIELINTVNLEIETLNSLYGPIPKKNFTITVANNKSLKINNTHWKWSLGITYSNPDRIIIKSPSISKISQARFMQVMKHELNHVMLNRFKFHHTIPRWFKEGFAMKHADEITLNHKISVAKHLHNAELFDINKYNNFHHFNRSEFNFAYSLSSIYILILEKLYGDSINDYIIRDLKNGYKFNTAFYNATGKLIDEFNIISYEYIKSNFFWYKLIQLPKNLFSLMPLLLVIGFYIRSKKNRKIKEQWELEEQLEDLENHINQ